MNFTKTKKIIAAGLSVLMMMCSATPVFAAESSGDDLSWLEPGYNGPSGFIGASGGSSGDKSANLNYQVSSSYDWIIHSSIDFGADAGVGKTVDRTGNQVKVLKNVIPEGKYLNISVKGSGANDTFTVSNGGSEVLNYDVSDDNGAVGVNGNVLSVPAGTNTAMQNMNFKLNTTKKTAEVAGQYNGRVIYNASVEAEPLKGGTTIDIEGTKHVVLEERENNQALVMTASSIGWKRFQAGSSIESRPGVSSDLRPDGQYINTYEGSEIDNYLENEWYNNLSSTMKTAIQTTNIKQASYPYETYDNPDSKQETGHNGQVYNTIGRHVYLPSVEELGKAVDLKSPDKIKAFLNDNSIWTRDSAQRNGNSAVYLYAYYGSLREDPVDRVYDVRPAFVIDLSQVNYSVVK